ncbi:MAG: lipoyl(octanoyl) transferase LipB [Actinobacteria bacterium]|nr:lipoyl(octanoyl) transferase LipB [Actinomycetota bacterium]MSZ12864.1 lipoyl(octanoyl) transferase LipB [Actinomycetota bacterium]MSZ28223.1 lipoyl(octanoyl) transferase LipB [Actinomycetota bacterium]
MEYEQAWELQRTLHTDVATGAGPNSLILLEHPSVYTAGRRTEEFERPLDGSKVIEVDRGGRITWHGPGQLVGYPIVKLLEPTEVVGFVREIESALINVCSDLGVNALRIEGRSGVWVVDSQGDRKIAAIGVRVAKGVTMHGFALNVNPDLTAYDQIVACGIRDAQVTSLQKELGREITIEEISEIVETHVLKSLRKVSS